MRKISSREEERIVELWCQGFPRDVIARRVGVSGSVVSGIAASFPPCLPELRSLNLRLRKSGATVNEAIQGANLLSKLNQLGVEVNGVSSFVGAFKKVAKKSGYSPAEVVQAAMKLSELEEQSGKSYAEAIEKFDATLKSEKIFKEKNLEAKKRLGQTEAKLEITKRENRDTLDKIRRYEFAESALAKHGVKLEDVETLSKYLNCMKEVKAEPKLFLELAKKQATLKGTLVQLREQIERESQDLRSLKSEHSELQGKVKTAKTQLAQLEDQTGSAGARVQELTGEVIRLETETQAKQMKLSRLLKAEATVEAVEAKAKDAEYQQNALEESYKRRHTEMETQYEGRKKILEGEIAEKQEKAQGLAKHLSNLDSQIRETLNVRDRSTDVKVALDKCESMLAALNQEIDQKQDKLAFAEVITGYLMQVPGSDFDQFYRRISEIAQLRKTAPHLVNVIREKTEQLCDKAIEVFRDSPKLVPKQTFDFLKQHKNRVVAERAEFEQKVSDLENGLKAQSQEIELLKTENKLLKELKAAIEGQETTLGNVFEKMMTMLNEEVQRRADARFDATAARAYGFLEYISDKIKGTGT